MPQRSMAVFVATCFLGTVHAGDWSWSKKFTEGSSPELIELHSQIYASGALGKVVDDD